MAYATETNLTDYITARGITLTGDNGTPAQILVKAHDYIESLDYRGERYDDDQANAWPRSYVYIDNIEVDQTTVPQDIIDSEIRVAIEIDAGNNPLANVDRVTKREKIGDLEFEYMDRSSDSVRLTAVNAVLDKYTTSNSNSAFFNVVKG